MVDVVTAQPRHLEALARLCVEMNEFYSEMPGAPLDEIRTRIEQALFDPPPGEQTAGHALLAFTNDDEVELVGFASYSDHWPAAALGRSMWIKELYVMHHARRVGVGRALMNEVFRIAAYRGCTRVEWTTETDNTAAQAFYGRLGATAIPEKVYYRRTIAD